MLNFGVFQYSMYNLSYIYHHGCANRHVQWCLTDPDLRANGARGYAHASRFVDAPGALVNAVMSPINGKLFDRFGGRILAVTV